jgi:transcriptional regulator with XRE-family HTH domain
MLEAELRKEFGRRLHRLRRHRELTQEQLAELAKLDVRFIQAIEGGAEAPSFKTMPRIAEALSVEVMELFRFDESIPLRKNVNVSEAGLREEFGHQLQLLRVYRKISKQKRLAELAGVTPGFISAIERGLESPSFETLAKLAEVLNVEVIELFRFRRRLMH